MSVPGPPEIRVRPKVFETALEFWWSEPLGGSTITSYQIVDSVNVISNDIIAPAGNTIISSLVTGTPYSFQLYASNGDGQGQPASFRTVQVGIKPGVPTNILLRPENASTATLFYTLPDTYATNPGGFPTTPALLASVVCAPEESGPGPGPAPAQIQNPAKNFVQKQSQFPELSSQTIHVTPGNDYNFIARAVNDAGYSPLPAPSQYPGKINLTPQIISTNVMYAFYTGAGNITDAIQVINESVTPPLTSGAPIQNSIIGGAVYKANPNGFVVGLSNSIDTSSRLIFYDKQGYSKHTSSILGTAGGGGEGRVNSCISLITDAGSGNFNYTVFNTSTITNQSFTSSFTQAGHSLLEIKNLWYDNTRVITWNGALEYGIHTIPNSTKVLSTLYVGEIAAIGSNENQFDQSFYALTKNATDLSEKLVYIPGKPNSRPQVFDISDALISTVTYTAPLTGSTIVVLEGNTSTICTVDLSIGSTIRRQPVENFTGLGAVTFAPSLSDYYNGVSTIGAMMYEPSTGTTGYTFYSPYGTSSSLYVDDFSEITTFTSPSLVVKIGSNASGDLKAAVTNAQGGLETFTFTDEFNIPLNQTYWTHTGFNSYNSNYITIQMFDYNITGTSSITYTINNSFEVYKSTFNMIFTNYTNDFTYGGTNFGVTNTTSTFSFSYNSPPLLLPSTATTSAPLQTNPISEYTLFQNSITNFVDIYKVSTFVSSIDMGVSAGSIVFSGGPSHWAGYDALNGYGFHYVDTQGFKTSFNDSTLTSLYTFGNSDNGFYATALGAVNNFIYSYNSTLNTFTKTPYGPGTLLNIQTTFEPFIV